MDGETLARVLPAAASSVALVLSLAGLYLQRRDRRPRLKVRVRYEYRANRPAGSPGNFHEGPSRDPSGNSSGEASGPASEPPRIHDDSQEGLYLRLGDFLREHGTRYPEGHSVVRFSLSNEGEKVVYLGSVRLLLLAGTRLGARLGARFGSRLGARYLGERLVLDPVRKRVLPAELAGPTADILGSTGGDTGRSPGCSSPGHSPGRSPVEIVPGDAVGYRFGLTALANTLAEEGYEGDRRLFLEAVDRVGNVYRCSFGVDTGLWALPEQPPGSRNPG